MATASQLIAKFKATKYFGSNQPFLDAASLIETTYRTKAYALLEDSVSQAAVDGISIEFKGLGDAAPEYSYVLWADIYMPTNPPMFYPPMDIMTYFLFETRNAMRAKKSCELRRKAAHNEIVSNSYVYFCGEYEARGGLEIGEMWDALIKEKKLTVDDLTYYPSYCYNKLYKLYPNWKIQGSPDLGKAIDSVLNSSYSTGGTRRDTYAKEFKDYTTVPKYKAHANSTCIGSSLSTP
jgi:hypothetical protein